MMTTSNRFGRRPGQWIATAMLAIAVTFGAADARAAPCAAFTDVDSTSPFCPNVEWIRNRGVTLGCSSATLYCPNDSVSRLAMAAFMNRLGTALTPVQLRVNETPGALDLDIANVACQTADYAVFDFPRRAFADVVFTASAAGDVTFATDLVVSTNGGGTWINLTAGASRASVGANRWIGSSDLGTVDLDVGQTMRWGVRLTRGGVAGSVDLADSRCQLRVLIHSRNGTTSPY